MTRHPRLMVTSSSSSSSTLITSVEPQSAGKGIALTLARAARRFLSAGEMADEPPEAVGVDATETLTVVVVGEEEDAAAPMDGAAGAETDAEALRLDRVPDAAMDGTTGAEAVAADARAFLAMALDGVETGGWTVSGG
jgi:hypothetical protein